MVFILTGEPISDTKVPVMVEYTELGYADLEANNSHLIPRLITIEARPELDPTQSDKKAIWYINPITKKMWYEYEDIPLTETQRRDRDISDLQQAMASILGM